MHMVAARHSTIAKVSATLDTVFCSDFSQLTFPRGCNEIISLIHTKSIVVFFRIGGGILCSPPA